MICVYMLELQKIYIYRVDLSEVIDTEKKQVEGRIGKVKIYVVGNAWGRIGMMQTTFYLPSTLHCRVEGRQRHGREREGESRVIGGVAAPAK